MSEGSGPGIAIYSINAGNGGLTLVKLVRLFDLNIPCVVLMQCGTGHLTADPSGKFLYFLANGGVSLDKTGSVGAFAIDPVTGHLTVALYPTPLGPHSIAVDMIVTP